MIREIVCYFAPQEILFCFFNLLPNWIWAYKESSKTNPNSFNLIVHLLACILNRTLNGPLFIYNWEYVLSVLFFCRLFDCSVMKLNHSSIKMMQLALKRFEKNRAKYFQNQDIRLPANKFLHLVPSLHIFIAIFT